MYNKQLAVIKDAEVLGKTFQIFGTAQNPLFKASDVACWIGHSDVSKMVRRVDEDEKLLRTIVSSGQQRETWFLTEHGLYEVLMQSRKAMAQKFKKKIKEILTTLRKTGIYLSNGDLALESYCNGYSEDEISHISKLFNNVDQGQREIIELYAKAELYDKFISGKGCYSFEAAAKILGIGRNKLMKELRFRKVLNKNNLPYQQYMRYFELKGVTTRYGFNCTQTLVRPEGLEFITRTLNKAVK